MSVSVTANLDHTAYQLREARFAESLLLIHHSVVLSTPRYRMRNVRGMIDACSCLFRRM
jgi:hypothetical protein